MGGARPKTLLRYRADLWCLALVGAVLLGQLALFFLAPSLGWAALGVAALFPLQSVTIACVHNHHHKPVFTAGWLNRLYEMVLFLQTGLPPYLMTLHHNLGHHHHYLTPEKDTLCWPTLLPLAGLGLLDPLRSLLVFGLPMTANIRSELPRFHREIRHRIPPALVNG
jgi:hypothetical protein